MHLLLLSAVLTHATPVLPGTPAALSVLGARHWVGTERGLFRSGPLGFEPVFTREPVLDLAGAPDGSLVFATQNGVYEWREGGSPPVTRLLVLPARVRGIAVDGDGTVWVATAQGLLRRNSGQTLFDRRPELGARDVHSVRAIESEIWAATPGILWVGDRSRPFARVRSGIPRGWWELADAARVGSETFLAVPAGLWRVKGVQLEPIGAGPGASRALASHDGRLWLATDRGVYLVGKGGPAATASLAVEAFDLASTPEGLLVASRRGVLPVPQTRSAETQLKTVRAEGRARRPAGLRRTTGDLEEVRALHRRVLSFLGLSPRRLDELELRARRVGYWPVVRATFTGDRDRARGLDLDQTVSSGNLWALRDSDREHGTALRFQVQLTWDLPRLAAPDDRLGISKERREVVELAERILDRVTRIYFKRKRLLTRLWSLSEDRAGERSSLLLEVQELGATLDGLTGGAFPRIRQAGAR
ncbi:MAG: hypothetical protein V3T14_09205 [Myxococcota bacterium]